MEPTFAKLVGDNGSYGFTYDGLKQIPARKVILIEEKEVTYEAPVAAWREYGIVKRYDNKPTMVYLPIEYFKKNKHGV